jgi:hypothetical protein
MSCASTEITSRSVRSEHYLAAETLDELLGLVLERTED